MFTSLNNVVNTENTELFSSVSALEWILKQKYCSAHWYTENMVFVRNHCAMIFNSEYKGTSVIPESLTTILLRYN